MGGQSIPSRPSDLLVVVVDASGQIVMDDKSDIRLVDPHAEGDRRHDDPDIVAAEALLVLGALFFRQARVVLVTNDMSGIVAHNLSGLGWSPLEVTDEMDRDATGDPEDAI